MAKQQLNARVSDLTRRQLDELGKRWGTTQTETLTVIIDRIYQKELTTMTNNTVIIPQKMSGTGTIHDLANQHFDRQIVFGDNDQYAIVLAAYYGNGDLYYTAASKEDALRIHEAKREFSHGIIDRNGNAISLDALYNG